MNIANKGHTKKVMERKKDLPSATSQRPLKYSNRIKCFLANQTIIGNRKNDIP